MDYYKDRDDVRAKFFSYYYLGRIYTNANNLTQATLAYMEAEQLVDELGDDYAAGLLYTQMGNIYRNYYDYPKALQSYRLSTEHYHKADKPLHKLYGMLSQSAIYKSMGKETDSFHTLYNTLTEAKETNQTSVIKHCLGDLILLCLDMDKPLALENGSRMPQHVELLTNAIWVSYYLNDLSDQKGDYFERKSGKLLNQMSLGPILHKKKYAFNGYNTNFST